MLFHHHPIVWFVLYSKVSGTAARQVLFDAVCYIFCFYRLKPPTILYTPGTIACVSQCVCVCVSRMFWDAYRWLLFSPPPHQRRSALSAYAAIDKLVQFHFFIPGWRVLCAKSLRKPVELVQQRCGYGVCCAITTTSRICN